MSTWSELYSEHAASVWAFLLKLGQRGADAEDCLHEVFLIAAERLGSFDASRGSARAWLFGIAVNVVRTARRRQRELPKEHSKETATADGENGPEALERARLRTALLNSLAALEPASLEVFVAFELEGIGCDAIAKRLGIPVGTVYSRLHKARSSLRATLAEQHAVGDAS